MDNAIAIIGMDCKFPNAKDKDEYWNILKEGIEAVKDLDIPKEENECYSGKRINRSAVIDDIDKFDAEFFNISPKDALFMDPQHRLFLQSAWRAFEDAGYIPDEGKELTGVFVGVGLSTYLIYNILPSIWGKADAERYMAPIVHGNSGDYLASRTAYKLNLKGPSLTVQTACSSSLTAVHLACRSLLMYECDVAVTGGASINTLQENGYIYQKGEILSPDGHCRPFDEMAEGTVFSGGVGSLILKRYEDAIESNDYIYAVIRGSAINNDGAHKVSYTAPSTEGQRNVISDAIVVADVDPGTISYIEAHGTGTRIGDPIEMNALKGIFPYNGEKYCKIGSVKGNIGHAIAAAGIAGLIKTVLCLEHGCLCPSINCSTENKAMGLNHTPFEVNKKLIKWEKLNGVRRAGVSSFGMGGSNAHIVLEEFDNHLEANYSKNKQIKILKLSAKTQTALNHLKENLAVFLELDPINIDNLLYTYNECRKDFSYQEMVLFHEQNDLIQKLGSNLQDGIYTKLKKENLGLSEYQKKPLAVLLNRNWEDSFAFFQEMYEKVDIFKQSLDDADLFIKNICFFSIKDCMSNNLDMLDKKKKETILFCIHYLFLDFIKNIVGDIFIIPVNDKSELLQDFLDKKRNWGDLSKMYVSEQTTYTNSQISECNWSDYELMNLNNDRSLHWLRGYSSIDSIQSLFQFIFGLWEKGWDIAYENIYDYMNGNRIPLPAYAFDKEQFWMELPKDRKSGLSKETIDDAESKETGIKVDIQGLVKEIWSDYLGIDEIEEDTDFFEMGGHSLLAIQIINELESRLHLNIPLESILLTPTVNHLVSIIDNIKRGGAA